MGGNSLDGGGGEVKLSTWGTACNGKADQLSGGEGRDTYYVDTDPSLVDPALLHLVSPQPGDILHSQLECALADVEGARPETLIIHPDNAASRNVSTGDLLRVFNARGSYRARASVSNDINPGAVALPTGAWYGGPGGNIDPDGTQMCLPWMWDHPGLVRNAALIQPWCKLRAYDLDGPGPLEARHRHLGNFRSAQGPSYARPDGRKHATHRRAGRRVSRFSHGTGQGPWVVFRPRHLALHQADRHRVRLRDADTLTGRTGCTQFRLHCHRAAQRMGRTIFQTLPFLFLGSNSTSCAAAKRNSITRRFVCVSHSRAISLGLVQ